MADSGERAGGAPTPANGPSERAAGSFPLFWSSRRILAVLCADLADVSFRLYSVPRQRSEARRAELGRAR